MQLGAQFTTVKSGTRWGTISTLPIAKGRLRLLFENRCNRSSTLSVTMARNGREIPLIALRVKRRVARARRNYARRPSRDGDNSRFRLRSLIETRPSFLGSPRDDSILCARHMERVKRESFLEVETVSYVQSDYSNAF